MPFALSVNDLDKDAKKRLSRMSEDATKNVSVRNLCNNRLKVMKSRGGNFMGGDDTQIMPPL